MGSFRRNATAAGPDRNRRAGAQPRRWVRFVETRWPQVPTAAAGAGAQPRKWVRFVLRALECMAPLGGWLLQMASFRLAGTGARGATVPDPPAAAGMAVAQGDLATRRARIPPEAGERFVETRWREVIARLVVKEQVRAPAPRDRTAIRPPRVASSRLG